MNDNRVYSPRTKAGDVDVSHRDDSAEHIKVASKDGEMVRGVRVFSGVGDAVCHDKPCELLDKGGVHGQNRDGKEPENPIHIDTVGDDSDEQVALDHNFESLHRDLAVDT